MFNIAVLVGNVGCDLTGPALAKLRKVMSCLHTAWKIELQQSSPAKAQVRHLSCDIRGRARRLNDGICWPHIHAPLL